MRNDIPPKWFKDPDSVIARVIAWTNWLDTGDTITGTPTWTIPAGLTKVSQSNTTTQARVVISGGTAGTTYECKCRITTTNGETEDQTFFIAVRDR